MEFDYLKVGDKCWVWDSKTNSTSSDIVERIDVSGWVRCERYDTWFSPETGQSESRPNLRLVHAPFKAEFPPKPKPKVVKEAEHIKDFTSIPWGSTSCRTFAFPHEATNVKCTYEIEE